MSLRGKNKDMYSKILDNAFSSGNIRKEIKEFKKLLDIKDGIDKKLIEGFFDKKTLNELKEVLELILKKLSSYTKTFRIVKKVSTKFKDNKNHSSHVFARKIDEIQKLAGINLIQVIENFELKIKYISENDIDSYFKSDNTLNINSFRKLFPYILKTRYKLVKPMLTLILIIIISFKYGIFYNQYKKYEMTLLDNQTKVEEVFYYDTGVRIYSPLDKEVKIISDVLIEIYQDPKFLEKKGLKRIILSDEFDSSFYFPLLDELNLVSSVSELDFLENFFHESGHFIHDGLSNKRIFEKEIKKYFEKEIAKKGLKNLLRDYKWIISGLDYEFNEQIARFYAARMFDLYFFFQDHGRLPTLSEILEKDYYNNLVPEEKEAFVGLIKIFYEYGFFPRSFNTN